MPNALNRLSEEALHVGADVVVGVELRRGEHELAKRTIDYLISGTAIRLPGSTKTNWPLLSDLSVPDYWRLHEAGYEPAGLVAATSVRFASPSQGMRRRRMPTLQSNQELAELSQAFHVARDAVRQRLLSQAQGYHADGTVGVELSHTVHPEELPAAPSVPSRSPAGWNRGVLGIPTPRRCTRRASSRCSGCSQRLRSWRQPGSSACRCTRRATAGAAK